MSAFDAYLDNLRLQLNSIPEEGTAMTEIWILIGLLVLIAMIGNWGTVWMFVRTASQRIYRMIVKNKPKFGKQAPSGKNKQRGKNMRGKSTLISIAVVLTGLIIAGLSYVIPWYNGLFDAEWITLNGSAMWIADLLYWLVTLSLLIVTIVAIVELRKWLKSRRRDKTTDTTGKDWHASIWFTIEFQHSAAVYWYWFGRGKIRRTRDAGTYFKWPWLEIVEVITRKLVDVEIETQQLPAGRIAPSGAGRARPEEAHTDRARLEIDKARARERRVSGTLSYKFRMTVSTRSAKETDEYKDGIQTIMQSDKSYRDFTSKEFRARFGELIAARLREVLPQMPFEDAFFIPPMVILLGRTDEIAGDDSAVSSKRWQRLQDDSANAPKDVQLVVKGLKKPINIFRIDLNEPEQVVAAVRERSNSLLATFFNLGYKVTRFGISDINPPEELQNALKKLANAELERDAQLTVYQSQFVDKAEAERDQRNIQADASNYTFEVFVSKAEEVAKKYSIPLMVAMEFMRFLEDRRTRRLMEGRLLQVDVSSDNPIPAALLSLSKTFEDLLSGKTAPPQKS